MMTTSRTQSCGSPRTTTARTSRARTWMLPSTLLRPTAPRTSSLCGQRCVRRVVVMTCVPPVSPRMPPVAALHSSHLVCPLLPRHPSPPLQGVILRFNPETGRGFGFVSPTVPGAHRPDDVWFHGSCVTDGVLDARGRYRSDLAGKKIVFAVRPDSKTSQRPAGSLSAFVATIKG